MLAGSGRLDAALIRTAANLIPREIDPLRVIERIRLEVRDPAA